MNNLKRVIIATIITETPETENDFRAIMRLIENDGEQLAFSKWLMNEIDKKGKNGWWRPMCLFRSYNLRRKKPGKETSNRIRAEIRAIIDASPQFIGGALNIDANKEIFEHWKQNNEPLILEALQKNSVM